MSRKFLTAVDLAKNELQNAVVQNLAGAPSSPVKGQLYMNSTDNTLYWWDGTTWIPAKATGGAFPGYGAVPAETTFGIAKSDGAATTVARSDHTHGSPTHDAAAHSTIPVSALGAATGVVNMNGQTITNVGAPVNPTDASNKGYVDNLVAGLAWKDSVKAASVANRTLSGTTTLDGVAIAAGDRVLMKNQVAGGENGIWVVAAGAWTRATDADTEAELLGAAVFVEQGTVNANTGWVMTSDAPITVGTTNTSWAQFLGGAATTAGAGLVQNVNAFDVGAGTGITVAADTVALDTTYTDGRYALAAAGSKRYAVDVGGSTSQVLTHNLNTLDVIVQVYRKAGPNDQIECDVEHTSVNTSTVRFAVAPSAAEYRAVVLA